MTTRNAHDRDDETERAVRTLKISPTGELESFYDIEGMRADTLAAKGTVKAILHRNWICWSVDDSRMPINPYAEHVIVAATGGPLKDHVYGDAHFFGCTWKPDGHGDVAQVTEHVPEVIWQSWVLLLVMRSQVGVSEVSR